LRVGKVIANKSHVQYFWPTLYVHRRIFTEEPTDYRLPKTKNLLI